jgi:hypothetical protein
MSVIKAVERGVVRVECRNLQPNISPAEPVGLDRDGHEVDVTDLVR